MLAVGDELRDQLRQARHGFRKSPLRCSQSARSSTTSGHERATHFGSRHRDASSRRRAQRRAATSAPRISKATTTVLTGGDKLRNKRRRARHGCGKIPTRCWFSTSSSAMRSATSGEERATDFECHRLHASLKAI